MKLKPGVQASVMHPSVHHALNLADSLHRAMFGTQATVTSIADGTHSEGSLHYGIDGDIRARGADLRSRHLTQDQTQEYAMKLRILLGTSFDVLVESDHIHLEYDPKVTA